MKKIILCFTVLLLLFANCNKDCKKGNCKDDDPCKIDRPKDLKPIDWDNYNDVYTVCLNLKVDCNDSNNIQTWWKKEIMVCAWVSTNKDTVNPQHFCLSDKNEFKLLLPVRTYNFFTESNHENFIDSLNSIFESADLTKKCFIKGTLIYFPNTVGMCCYTFPTIVINSANDIYFE